MLIFCTSTNTDNNTTTCSIVCLCPSQLIIVNCCLISNYFHLFNRINLFFFFFQEWHQYCRNTICYYMSRPPKPSLVICNIWSLLLVNSVVKHWYNIRKPERERQSSFFNWVYYIHCSRSLSSKQTWRWQRSTRWFNETKTRSDWDFYVLS